MFAQKFYQEKNPKKLMIKPQGDGSGEGDVRVDERWVGGLNLFFLLQTYKTGFDFSIFYHCT